VTDDELVEQIKTDVSVLLTKAQDDDHLSNLIAGYLQSKLGQGIIADYNYYPGKLPALSVMIEVSFPCNLNVLYSFWVFGEDPVSNFDRAMSIV
jgi:hypothetical protein